MPDYIKVKHDKILQDYFTKTTKSEGISENIIVYPLNSSGYMVLGFGRVKIIPNMDKGIVLFCLLWLVDVEELIEKYEPVDEKLHFITFLRISGEVLGVSEGMHTEFGVNPKLFTLVNTDTKPVIEDFFPSISKSRLIDMAREKLTETEITTEFLLDKNLLYDEQNEVYSMQEQMMKSEISEKSLSEISMNEDGDSQ
jgi:hypothetical protein